LVEKSIKRYVRETRDDHCSFYDNKSAITISKNSVFHSRTKHINFKHHYIREAVEDEEIKIKHVKTEDQLIDIFTKTFYCDKFVYFRKLLRITNKNIKGECLN
jgi:hypothetical protein